VIDPELKERVREAADIVEIIGESVPLKRVGTSYRGPCPFHQGKGPNFSVSASHRSYHCFVCGESGDVFSFLQKHLGMDFPAALRSVGQRVGIEIPEFDAGRRAGPDPREPMWEVLGVAAEYFRHVLWNEPDGEAARAYLASREIDRGSADRFGLGYAPADGFRAHMATLGFDDQRLVAAGLMHPPEAEGGARVRFRRRLIFPIFDPASHVVGFGGRLLGPGEPKYLNSPESPVFAKRTLLYGFNWAKSSIRRDLRVILVEGYFDLLRLVMAGIEAVVAPLGTALTPEQATMLARQTKQVFLLYDSDEAGLKATFRAGDELLRHGVRVRVATLPEGEDPDSFVAAHGRLPMEMELDKALDIFDRKIQFLERGGWFGDLDHKRRAIDKMLPTIRATTDPITQDLYVGRLSEVSGVATDVLWREVRGAVAEPAPTTSLAKVTVTRSAGSAKVMARVSPAERAIVQAVVIARSLLDAVAERLAPEGIRDARCRAIYAALLQAGPDATVDELVELLPGDAVELLQAMMLEGSTGADPKRVISDSLTQLRTRELKERAAAIDRQMAVASDAQKNDLMKEKARIMAEVKALGGRGYATYGKSRPRAS
jgi:DNA primase